VSQAAPQTVYQENVLEVEPFGIEPIPKQERHGQISKLFTIWFAGNLNVVTWFTGFLGIALGVSLKYVVLAIIIGNLLGGVLLALTSAFGPRIGQPLIPGSRRAFGKVGVRGLSFVNFINNIGWLAVDLVLSVMAFQKLVPLLGYHAALLILTVATILIAVYGYNFIHTFAYWMSIVMGVIFVAMTVITIYDLPAIKGASAAAAAGGFNPWMFIMAIALVFSYQISYCPIGSDYSRYLPENTSARRVWLASYLGNVLSCIWLEILGAVMAALGLQAASPMDFAKLMGAFTAPALITVVLSIMPNNVMAVYSGGLAALAMGVPLKRWTAALVTGGIAALLIVYGAGQFANTYENFLLLLSYWIAPWLGVIISDQFYRRQAPAAGDQGWKGILAFVCGVVISIPFMSSALYTGPVAKVYLGGADISYFISMLVSGAVYLVAIRGWKQEVGSRKNTLAETAMQSR
jgi:NCS1 family nucleobase:cation symporter-1